MRPLGITSKARPGLRIGVEERMFHLPPHTGHGRVWTELLPRLDQLAELTVGVLDPDVWLVDGHNGDPHVRGPVVACVYEIPWGLPEPEGGLKQDFAAQMESGTGAAVARADHILTGAKSSKRQILATYGMTGERVHVVPFGVDFAVFNPGKGSGAAEVLRQRTGDARPFVLFASSLHPRKNLRAVRGAVTGLARRGYPHSLVIVGSAAPDRAESAELEKEAFADLPEFPGRVIRFVDPTDAELSMLMAGADAVCQPSLAEGFGLTVLEAMAAGAAVVVSDRGSLPEVVGRAGKIVEPTSDGVERALLEIITRDGATQRMRTRALRRARAMSWDRTAEGWLSVLQRAASQKTKILAISND